MKIRLFGLAALLFACASTTLAGDVEDLATLLDEFLAHAGEAPAHERFWAEDLVYTSSAGTRTNKAEILAGFEDPASADENADGPVYHAEDVDIRLYGDMAVVAFRLVADSTAEPGEPVRQYYLNTGTFRKHDGMWKAVAWQATKVPEPE